MIRFTQIASLLVVGAVLAGCTSTEPQTPPASTAASTQAPGADSEEKPAESPTTAPQVTIEWTDIEFTAQGNYTAADVSEAADTLEAYVHSAFANTTFLSGEWYEEPTGATIAEELEAHFTQARLDFIETLDPKSADPNVLNDVNSVVFLLYPEGEAPVWKQPEEPAVIEASALTFAEEPSTKALKASFVVTIAVPVQTADSKGTSTTTYTINAWLIDDAGTMKIDGYANSWKISPYAS